MQFLTLTKVIIKCKGSFKTVQKTMKIKPQTCQLALV